MKINYILLIALFTLFFHPTDAQIDLENMYDGYTQPAKLEVKGPVYYTIDFISSKCILYNADHTPWKTIDIVPPENKYIYDILYVSQHLFNTDDLVEMAVEFFEYKEDNGSGYYEYTTRVINEEGGILLSVDGGAFPTVFLTGENTAKLSIYVYDYLQLNYPIATYVYSIPGVPSSVGNNNKVRDEFKGYVGTPFPNPVKDEMKVPFDLHGHPGTYELKITDATGTLIDRFGLDPALNGITINVSNYAKGTYIYWIESNGSKSQSRKFIIN